MGADMKPNSNPDTAFDAIGTVAKVHGLKGEIGIRIELPLPNQLLNVETVYMAGDFGMLQPWRIQSSRLSVQGEKQMFFVILEMVADRNAAQALVGRHVLLDSGLVDLFDEVDDDDLAGYAVIDANGNMIGNVLETLENPAHPILRVHIKGKGEVLIPFVDVYVDEVDDDEQTVTVVDIDELLEL
jgi:16S rRNA processing protein RimM